MRDSFALKKSRDGSSFIKQYLRIRIVHNKGLRGRITAAEELSRGKITFRCLTMA